MLIRLIIALVLIITIFGYTSYAPKINKAAEDDIIKKEAVLIDTALKNYYLSQGKFPTTLNDITEIQNLKINKFDYQPEDNQYQVNYKLTSGKSLLSPGSNNPVPDLVLKDVDKWEE